VDCNQAMVYNNIMTVDLEDYYCDLPISRWNNYESRIVNTTRTILGLFNEYKVNATFFTVGYIAEQHPELVEEVVSKGHEIASHGYSHPNVKKMNIMEFESDLVKSIEVLRKVSGEKVMGFRAPYFSINKQNLWAFDVIRKHLRYDSSVFPIKFHYGLSKAPRHIYRMSYKEPLSEDADSKFVELPMTTLKLPIVGNFPIGGGHYLRFLPCSILNAGIKRFNKAGFPAIFYIHPKDLDPATPRIPGYAWHNYWGLKKATEKFKSVLKNFRFSSVHEVLAI
jgi:peptidoglycan-N-acetylglucosamine deacetylase